MEVKVGTGRPRLAIPHPQEVQLAGPGGAPAMKTEWGHRERYSLRVFPGAQKTMTLLPSSSPQCSEPTKQSSQAQKTLQLGVRRSWHSSKGRDSPHNPYPNILTLHK